MDFKSELRKILHDQDVCLDAEMSRYTSFKAGGTADYLLTVHDRQQLARLLNLLTCKEIPHMILGKGSNVIVRDGGYRGVFVRLGSEFELIRVDEETGLVEAGSMVGLPSLARSIAAYGLTGFEFAGGIPGSLGGAVFMNAGAYGGEIKDVLLHADLMSPDGKKVERIPNEDLDLSYRHSRIKEEGGVVLSAAFQFEKGDFASIDARMKELAQKRNKKQPLSLPSAGSFFKRPPGHFAGKLIEDAGLKGLRVGGAQISDLHAGFMVNRGGASVADIERLMHIVQATVLDKFGVKLEPEPIIVGEAL